MRFDDWIIEKWIKKYAIKKTLSQKGIKNLISKHWNKLVSMQEDADYRQKQSDMNDYYDRRHSSMHGDW